MTESRPDSEGRTSLRELVTLPVTYDYMHHELGQMKSYTRTGISRDLSATGICIYTSVNLDTGMLLNVYGETAWDGARKGSVKWCRMITDELYRVGVQLLN